ncbi:MAG TPA: hypothetical protein GX008_00695 [Firmicutes bacterium]|nr:MAG: hypothetical protein AA931_06225 [Peptococcaceae bacterium 1109]HHT72216.1 hypothetical protein [Bacillota bacterium]
MSTGKQFFVVYQEDRAQIEQICRSHNAVEALRFLQQRVLPQLRRKGGGCRDQGISPEMFRRNWRG